MGLLLPKMGWLLELPWGNVELFKLAWLLLLLLVVTEEELLLQLLALLELCSRVWFLSQSLPFGLNAADINFDSTGFFAVLAGVLLVFQFLSLLKYFFLKCRS